MFAAPDLICHYSGLPEFQQRQYTFAAHIRNPDKIARPAGVAETRMAVYNELFYNNIAGVLSSAFPVIRSLNSTMQWHAMVRDFFERHHAVTPYITELPREFLDYLRDERRDADDPIFLRELAHYEWAELALSIDQTEIDTHHFNADGNLMQGVPLLSPLAWVLSYQFPVHKISPAFRPDEVSEQTTHIVVYRNLNDEVGFVEINPITARLLHMMDGNRTQSGAALLRQIASEMQHPNPATVIEGGRQILNELYERKILLGTYSASQAGF
jgi:hypothetical protein